MFILTTSKKQHDGHQSYSEKNEIRAKKANIKRNKKKKKIRDFYTKFMKTD